MPGLELKSLRNRNKTRSNLHLSSTPASTLASPPTSPTPVRQLPSTTGPSSSSSDERPNHNKSPSSSISSSSFFDEDQWKRVVRIRERDGMRGTVWWGYILLGTTWIFFILGIGGVCGVWEWSLRPLQQPGAKLVVKGDEALAMSGYYSALMVLTGAVVAWIWVVFNWVGMKYFRHN